MSEAREALKALFGMNENDCEELSRDLAATCGSIDEPGLQISFHGVCPVQGYGIVDDYPCYYRARDVGSFEVFVRDTDLDQLGRGGWWPDVVWEAPPFDADGWDEAAITEANIRAAVAQFREWRQTVAGGSQ